MAKKAAKRKTTKKKAVRRSKLRKAEDQLRDFAMAYPETTEEWPWGHRAVKVRGKIFTTLTLDDDGLHMSMKLPISNKDALAFPFTEPTHYGMGKHGWVSSHFTSKDTPPVALLEKWIDESFRSIAPKTLVKTLGAEPIAKPKRKR